MISKEYLDKFKRLYKDKYDISLNDEEATELATHFLNLMEILIKPTKTPNENTVENNDKVTLLEEKQHAISRI